MNVKETNDSIDKAWAILMPLKVMGLPITSNELDRNMILLNIKRLLFKLRYKE